MNKSKELQFKIYEQCHFELFSKVTSKISNNLYNDLSVKIYLKMDDFLDIYAHLEGRAKKDVKNEQD